MCCVNAQGLPLDNKVGDQGLACKVSGGGDRAWRQIKNAQACPGKAAKQADAFAKITLVRWLLFAKIFKIK